MHKKIRSYIIFILSSIAIVNVYGGELIDRLQVGDKIYLEVEVKKVTPKALLIKHSAGIAQVLLADLSPKYQKKFGYNAAVEDAYNKKIEARKREVLEARAKEAAKPKVPKTQVLVSDRILQRFGQTPELRGEVDLRPRYRELKLISKAQGRRPSCSVFAVVSALEYQNAIVVGEAEKLSEEYLIWATRKTLGFNSKPAASKGGESKDDPNDADAGFNLVEVVQALRSYGVPLQDEMPNTFGKSMAKIEEPTADLIEEAKNRRKVYSYVITGRENKEKIDGIVHALNEEVPVVIGMAWPHYKSLQNVPVLRGQKPREDYAHAVTLVGYRCESGRREDILFIFKNSWGNEWGIAGHGYVAYPYLEKHINSAIFLEVAL
jgi:hypothetical protein